MNTKWPEGQGKPELGEHFCAVHESPEEHIAIAVRFLKQGGERGHQCILSAREELTTAILAGLALEGVEVQAEQARGALQTITSEQCFFPSGRFEPQAVIDSLRVREAAAWRDGFMGLSVSADMIWASNPRVEPAQLIHYEALLSSFLVDSPSAVICHYERASLDAALIHDVLLTHPVAVVGGYASPNPYYQPPDYVLNRDRLSSIEFKRHSLAWWLERLEHASALRRERERAQTELREKEELVGLLLDSTAEAIYGIDREGKCILANPACARLLGQGAPADLTGRNLHELTGHSRNGAPCAETDCPICQVLHNGEGTYIAESLLTRRDGSRFHAEIWSHPIRRKGALAGAVVAFLDISERKKLEQQFLRAQRMESIGTLAGGIAHDLNNVLAPILMCVELIKFQTGDERVLEVLKTVETSARRGASMVQQVLSFARGAQGERVTVQLRHLVRDLLAIVRETFPKTIRARSDMPRDIWLLQADATQLHQLLLNLCVNARDAMPQGGELIITCENVMLDGHHAAIAPGSPSRPHVIIKVADTGSGIPEAIKDRIFDPFFTTKETGKGTGLGLATVQAIVKGHGGFINYYSEPGNGTVFKVYLPASPEAALEKQADEIHLPRGQGELILVVDDEGAIRSITKQTLEAFGYQVVTASDGAEAVAIYARQLDKIAAVLTDLQMPVMDGVMTINALKRINPEVKIACASGLNSTANVAAATQAGVKHFLPKPYTSDRLLQALCDLLTPSA